MVQGGSKSASAPQISASTVPPSARGQSTQAKAAVLDSPSTATRLPRTLTAPEPEKASAATHVWSCWQFRQDVAHQSSREPAPQGLVVSASARAA